MSSNKMLIDATHPEETRVVVLRGGRVEEFDYESAARKLLRGNIYLAKVTRVEPSLQAAFVDYGGNRHGFLAFNEIHPDYYQIPMADRQALIDEEAQAEAEEEAAADARAEASARRRRQHQKSEGASRHHGEAESPESSVDAAPESERGDAPDNGEADDNGDVATTGADDTAESEDTQSETATYAESSGLIEIAISEMPPPETVGGFGQEDDGETADTLASDAEEGDSIDDAPSLGDDGNGGEDDEGEPAEAGDGEAGRVQEVTSGAEPTDVEQVGSDDALDEFAARPRPRRRTRSYKIQEVIKRRQVILVQVVKEERGTKGAALTTYLSLAGRYTVLMPNTARGGGISRKISNPQDRKRLKAIAQELEVPEGMGLIIRTAGAARTAQEIKRDFEYLLRLWESVRELTLQSEAPSLVYEEGNLIKRSIRDLYNKDVDEIIVAGSESHRDAREFMRMLMPSHAKNVIEYQAPEPLFTRYGIERQLNAMFSPYVTLRSGGYLVINQTEALVAIDVNSGKSTREFSIEETALNTNLEAADEIARQVKLRDLAGLIVIDFIDMEEKRNNRAVERRLKDALRFDRARIQLGRISHFGLMEMSRQRLRTGVLEGSTTQCPHCQGTGIIRSTESVALAVLRGLEDAVMAGARTPLIATTTPTIALYILNNKRSFILDMEARLGMPVTVQGSDKLQGANFTIEKGSAPATTPLRRTDRNAVNMDWGFDGDEDEVEASVNGYDDAAEDGDTPHQHARGGREGDAERDGNDEGARRRRRRRRRGGRRGDRFEGDAMRAGVGETDDGDDAGSDDATADADGDRISFVADEAHDHSLGDPDDIETVDRDGGDEDDDTQAQGAGANGDGRRRGRRRGRRGGRRNRERSQNAQPPGLEPQPDIDDDAHAMHADDETAGSAGAHPAEMTSEASEDVAATGVTPAAEEQLPADADAEAAEPTAPVSEAPAHEPTERKATRSTSSGERRGRQRASESAEKKAQAAAKAEKANEEHAESTAAPIAVVEPGETAEPGETEPQPVADAQPEPVPAGAEPAMTGTANGAPLEAEETSAELPRHRQRARAEASEPRLERVVVRPNADGETSTEPTADRPARKGWWSRRFGSE